MYDWDFRGGSGRRLYVLKHAALWHAGTGKSTIWKVKEPKKDAAEDMSNWEQKGCIPMVGGYLYYRGFNESTCDPQTGVCETMPRTWPGGFF